MSDPTAGTKTPTEAPTPPNPGQEGDSATPGSWSITSAEPTIVAPVNEKEKDKEQEQVVEDKPRSNSSGSAPPAPKFSWARKNFLLAIFALSMFIDVLLYAGFFVLTYSVAKDLNIVIEQQSWVITSYSVTFAAFLLFWGRVSDLYSPKPVFQYGFIGLGILCLIISFLKDKYSFFVLRALAGICGSCLVPSAYRLIAYVFEPHELTYAFGLYGLAGAVSNMGGMVLAGFVAYIGDNHGYQNDPWRWFLRIVGIIVLPLGVLSMYVVPHPEGEEARVKESKWRRLDLIGALLMLATIVMLILGLTLGASYGFKKPGFLVPFLLSFVILLPSFFLWEGWLSDEHALLPLKTWKIRNFGLWVIFALEIYAWWGVNLLALTEIFMTVRGDKPIIAAVRHLPQPTVALVVVLFLNRYPVLISNPRWPITVGMLLAVAGYALFAQPTYWTGSQYWRWIFPGMIIGSGGTTAAFTATNVGFMTSVPPEMAGVAGAMLQISLQTGAAVAFGIQAGLLTIKPGGLFNNDNIRASFYFQLGWTALWLIGFLVFYRRGKAPAAAPEEQGEAAESVEQPTVSEPAEQPTAPEPAAKGSTTPHQR